MIYQCKQFKRNMMGTLRSKRYKTFKSLKFDCGEVTVTKLITIDTNQNIEWLQTQIYSRIDVIRRSSNIKSLPISEGCPLQVEIIKKDNKKFVYISKKYITGWNFNQLLRNKQQLHNTINKNLMKPLIWSFMALLLSGTGFNNIILTFQNIIFQKIDDLQCKPKVNIFSFAGIRLLQLRKGIDSSQFQQIAIFLDKQVLQSGKMNRFEFKKRNFAALILAVVTERDPNTIIFKGIQLPAVIEIETAQKIFANTITPRINMILKFASVQTAFKNTQINGLYQLVLAAFETPQQSINWAVIQNQLLGQKNQKSLIYEELADKLWNQESSWAQQILRKKGLSIGSHGGQAYLAVKINYHLQEILQSKDWQLMLKDQSYSKQNCNILYSILKSSLSKKNQILQSTIANWIDMAKNVYNFTYQANNGKQINIISHQMSILNDYPISFKTQ